ncbi:hypothetical protein Leryth_009479 [Lithospermum erythrorhizon]|nr:hypothetical protein Leryth_009479 [Lithospermum erythrorhizon]
MSRISHSTLLIFLSLLLLLRRSGGALAGGWHPIPDPTDKYVVEIAKFAVEEHNNKTNSQLKFGRVLKGDEQVVSGMNYRLFVEANHEGGLDEYVTVVYDKPWEKLRTLTSFDKVV